MLVLSEAGYRTIPGEVKMRKMRHYKKGCFLVLIKTFPRCLTFSKICSTIQDKIGFPHYTLKCNTPSGTDTKRRGRFPQRENRRSALGLTLSLVSLASNHARSASETLFLASTRGGVALQSSFFDCLIEIMKGRFHAKVRIKPDGPVFRRG